MNQDMVFRVAMRFMKNEVEAQDVAQDAFLNAFRKLDSFKGNSALSSWLYRVTANTALMRLRKKRRRGEVALEGLIPTQETSQYTLQFSWQERGDEEVEKKELRQKINEAVEELEPKYQDIFVLKEVEGLSLQEIAETHSLSVPAVKSRLHRARLSLRASLEKYVA